MTSYVIPNAAGQALARQHSTHLIEQLISQGALSSPEWRAVFGQVPRHLFAPKFRLPDNHGGQALDGTDASQQAAWLQAVYVNDALLTDFGDCGVLTRTCSAPSVVARMLEALRVTEGHSVLEIGTGTGWNAGLLATRLGSDAVTSVDIDPLFVQQARERLAVLDLHPTLDVADGYGGYPKQGPYDRIIATCSVRHIPPAWLQQIRPGGVILTDIRGDFAGGVARVTRTGDGEAFGEFLPSRISFMPLRSPEQSNDDESESDWPIGRVVSASGDTRTTDLDPDVLRASDSFALFAQFALPGTRSVSVTVGSDQTFFCLVHHGSQSWARVELGDDTHRPVTQGGTRHLWDELETAYKLWANLNRPARDQFTITVTPDGEQYVSLPESPHRWELPL
jgi:protein-L-isoaspartate(D-aspartate) O-methyltransferase